MLYKPYFKFLGFLIKNGKKSKAKGALNSIFKKLLYPSTINKKVFKELFLKLNVFIEVKTIKIKRKMYTIPFPIKFNRRFYVVSKWLISTALKNKSKVPFSKKLLQEMNHVISKKSSKVLKLRESTLLKAYSNRANAHFRW
jgi:ribosomal protein S7